ncbi:MAG: hypothetical protein WD315_05660 [Balneolaceae bacterium]
MIPIGFLELGITDLIEILVIALVLFYFYKWVRGTFAIQAALGLVFVILINAGVSILGLSTLNFILRSILDVGVLAVIIIFQPEIRKLCTAWVRIQRWIVSLDGAIPSLW